MTATPIAQWASENQMTLFKPESNKETLELISDIDLLITIGYGVLLPKEILDTPKFGCLNLHFSLLPRWRGAAPVQRAIESGDPITGVTVFKLDEGMDTGSIYSTLRFALDNDITSDELFLELADLGPDAVTQAIAAIEGGVKPIPQTETGASRAFKISKEECQIDWNQSAEVISRKIRAFTSSPGAWTTFRGTTLKVDSPALTEFVLPAGHIQAEKGIVYIGTGSTALSIGFLTPAGKSRMDSQSWLNGIRLESGETFG
jgi:methionyl-tRNA formyltransferase